MGRWEPNARGRLERAALELYGERGFEQTTVAEIAERPGLTERTFFRHYADKREVLFAGSDMLETLLERTVADAPPSAAPLDATVAALEAVGAVIQERGDVPKRRHAVIMASVELRERELIKLAALTSALAGALRRRGVADLTADLVAEAGVAAFNVAYERWVEAADGDLPASIRASVDELRAVAAGKSARS